MKKQHVLALFVAEILRLRQPRQADPRARARRLVHLPVNQRHLGLAAVQVDHARLDHLVIEVVALAGAFAHAGEHRIAAMPLGDIVDELHDEHGLADARAAEQADLAALGVGGQQVHHLDAGHQLLRLGGLVHERRRRAVDRIGLRRPDGPALVDGFADHIHDPPERFGADRHGDRAAGIERLLAAHEPFGRVHGDGAHDVLAQMLRHFEHQRPVAAIDMERVQDRRDSALEPDVHDGAQNLTDAADRIPGHLRRLSHLFVLGLGGLVQNIPDMLIRDRFARPGLQPAVLLNFACGPTLPGQIANLLARVHWSHISEHILGELRH